MDKKSRKFTANKDNSSVKYSNFYTIAIICYLFIILFSEEAEAHSDHHFPK